jgi:hypothetical protein
MRRSLVEDLADACSANNFLPGTESDLRWASLFDVMSPCLVSSRNNTADLRKFREIDKKTREIGPFGSHCEYRLKPTGISPEEALDELSTMYKVHLQDSKQVLRLSRVVTLTRLQETVLKPSTQRF